MLRGLCILGVMWHHLMYDVRYIFHYDAFEFFESFTFQKIIHPLMLIGFFCIAGISQSFSKNNLIRAKKIGGIAILLTIVSALLSYILSAEFYIIWQILHSLAFCILLTYLLQKYVPKQKKQFLIYLVLSMLFIFILPEIYQHYDLAHHGSPFLLPFGIGYLRPEVPTMLDYIPVIPLGGFFFIGVFLGQILYKDGMVKKELCAGSIWLPLRFLGKYSLYVYAIHQPIFIFFIWIFGRLFC